ncbi:uncharacterized protein LOC112081459 [Eutrema salsugineum]|uniref:uncharacterized protein LOC112081459 n=1 Tax=Eutrema salsugineum TaxID=72664 RepID=UPI000CECEB67|nr:uncharacterized protein LOC112081459 [Eutrema salsugineum]
MFHYDMEVKDIDGIPTAKIPESVFKDSPPLWANFLVGKFLAEAPFVGKIHALVNRIWTLGDKSVKIDVYVVDRTTVRFRINDPITRARVLRKGVPPHLFTWKGLSALTSPLGKPKKLHPDTEACRNLEETKSDNNSDAVVEYIFPWLPPRCAGCSKWGHLVKTCDVKSSAEIASLVERRPVETRTGEVEPRQVSPVKEKSGSAQADIPEALKITEQAKVKADEEGWITPTNPSRSPGKKAELMYGEVSILAKTRFGCLSGKDENGEQIDDLLERTKDEVVEEGIPSNVVEVEEDVALKSTEDVGTQNPDRADLVVEKVDKKLGHKGAPGDVGGGLICQSLPRQSKGSHKFLANQNATNAKGSNIPDHRLGRLWVIWRQNVRITPLYKSAQMITVSVLVEGRKEDFFVSFVYASNFVEDRKHLWDDIRFHNTSPLFRGKAWLIGGDFNEILRGDEHSQFSTSPSIPPGMGDFQDLVNTCELVDLAYQGQTFTWCNKRREGLICKKLDRVLVNKEWIHQYDRSYSFFEPGGCSDHLRCRFYIKEAAGRIKKPFKYTNVTSFHPNFQTEVKRKWDLSPPLFGSTQAMFRLTKKTQADETSLQRSGSGFGSRHLEEGKGGFFDLM